MLTVSVMILFTVIFASGCIIFRRKGKSFEGMVCKFMASFGFISISAFGYYINCINLKYFICILFALMFGFCGDVFLGIKEIAPVFKKRLIILGTFSFLLSHIISIYAFSSFKGINPITIIICVFLGVCVYFIELFFIKTINSGLRIVLAIYYFFLMWKVAVSIWVVYCEVNLTSIIILTASVLFLISDTCLGILYFTPVKRKNIFVTIELSTYYPAQILFALSVALLGR